jgi:hypothetical protein
MAGNGFGSKFAINDRNYECIGHCIEQLDNSRYNNPILNRDIFFVIHVYWDSAIMQNLFGARINSCRQCQKQNNMRYICRSKPQNGQLLVSLRRDRPLHLSVLKNYILLKILLKNIESCYNIKPTVHITCFKTEHYA